MRPRSNTTGHVDNATVGMLAASNPSMAGLGNFSPRPNHQPAMNELPGVRGYSFRGMSTALGHHGNHIALPKLETSGLSIDIGGCLKTAPPYGGPREPWDSDALWLGPESTVNPAQLHFSNSPQSLFFETPASPYDPNRVAMPVAPATLDDDGNLTWLNELENPMSLTNVNEQAVDGSSPSNLSTGSHSEWSEPRLDCFRPQAHSLTVWPNPITTQASATPGLPMERSIPTYQDSFAPGQPSPKSLQTHMGGTQSSFPMTLPVNVPTSLPMLHPPRSQHFHPPMIIQPESHTPSHSADPVSSSNRQSSTTSLSPDSIADPTLQALLAIPSAPPTHGHGNLTISQPLMSSSLSPAFGGPSFSVDNGPLPSTYNLQRYVAAYIKHFHPHLPFLHIPSLSFYSLTYTAHPPLSKHHSSVAQSVPSGGVGPVILAMAAIGALYEYEHSISTTLFDMTQKAIDVFIEERSGRSFPGGAPGPCSTMDFSNQASPLWFIQAMVLMVIFGHQSGENASSELASSRCATLVNLARSSQLPADELPVSFEQVPPIYQFSEGDETQMGGDETGLGSRNSEVQHESSEYQSEWCRWKLKEERKRALYVVFIMSSLLISGHAHTPALTNAEIRLALPCDEEMWAADSAESWMALGGPVVADNAEVPFTNALSYLLTANERQQGQQQYNGARLNEGFDASIKVDDWSEMHSKPSTFGCLILIHALFSYIWETRQRHRGRAWTTQEMQQMHDRVEPALKAWQAIWGGNPHHALEQPNSSGCGPLITDCIPLLDMAYLGLYVNLSRAKEAFWQRDFNAVANELARGPSLVPVTSNHDSTPTDIDRGYYAMAGSRVKDEAADGAFAPRCGNRVPQSYRSSSNRELHLRQAAYCAVNSLVMSIKMGVTFLNYDSRDLSMQSAVSVYDAAQVLAEWVSTVQERVGRFLGILGINYIDFSQAPTTILLHGEDCRLLEKIKGLVEDLESQLAAYGFTNGVSPNRAGSHLASMEGYGFGSKLLAITALMLKMAPVWPG